MNLVSVRSRQLIFSSCFILLFVLLAHKKCQRKKLCKSKNVILEQQQESQKYITGAIQEGCLCALLTLSLKNP